VLLLDEVDEELPDLPLAHDHGRPPAVRGVACRAVQVAALRVEREALELEVAFHPVSQHSHDHLLADPGSHFPRGREDARVDEAEEAARRRASLRETVRQEMSLLPRTRLSSTGPFSGGATPPRDRGAERKVAVPGTRNATTAIPWLKQACIPRAGRDALGPTWPASAHSHKRRAGAAPFKKDRWAAWRASLLAVARHAGQRSSSRGQCARPRTGARGAHPPGRPAPRVIRARASARAEARGGGPGGRRAARQAIGTPGDRPVRRAEVLDCRRRPMSCRRRRFCPGDQRPRCRQSARSTSPSRLAASSQRQSAQIPRVAAS
jgi:hypothetical protein